MATALRSDRKMATRTVSADAGMQSAAQFHLEWAVRSSGTRVIERRNLDPYVEEISWEDGSEEGSINTFPTLQGSVTLRYPHPSQQSSLPRIPSGSELILYALRDTSDPVDDNLSRYVRVWQMRVIKYNQQSDGSVSLELADPLRWLASSRSNFRFVKTGKKGPHRYGWKAHEIANYVCSRYRIPKSGTFMRGRYTLAKLVERSSSPIGVIRNAYAAERRRSGVRYVIRWDHATGAGMQIVPRRANTTRYVFGPQITDATVEGSLKAGFCTTLIGRWSKPGKYNKRKKVNGKWKTVKVPYAKQTIRVTASRDAVQKYGYIEKFTDYHAKNAREAKVIAERSLAGRLSPTRTLTFSHPGLWRIKRADAITVNLPQQGFSNKDCWVQKVSHTIRDQYTMQIVASFNNPMDPAQIRKEANEAARYRTRNKIKKR